ncbi:hypothetical protein ADH76_29715 [Enterocloster clostridioformis]|uniref:hypothetical protein n=1 Tax=Enterocloster clostridioformis TaxID=1531 RepID=UPI00080C9D4D|nr:hypothetical protein [Enterocloster clostridioformis]ANU45199.1 hypothetical protein A4V08_04525 [Lachnoclostridium sp. YL32]OXE63517.1 hypothetical protein ADH76_29715 [Enterocloster clostridioformis]QQR00034.1 hypothetical protein I5Q83_30095 [Enterocloster clostridioformis]
MAKPKKKNQLPSGQFRVQVYDYTDEDGKKHYKSFTAASKKLAQLAAAEWKANKDKPAPVVNDLSINEAAKRYLEVKKGVLSPSTLRGYERYHQELFKRQIWGHTAPRVGQHGHPDMGVRPGRKSKSKNSTQCLWTAVCYT